MTTVQKDVLKGQADILFDNIEESLAKSKHQPCTQESHNALVDAVIDHSRATRLHLEYATNGAAQDVASLVARQLESPLKEIKALIEERSVPAKEKAYTVGKRVISNASYKKMMTGGLLSLFLALTGSLTVQLQSCTSQKQALLVARDKLAQTTETQIDKERAERRMQFLTIQSNQLAAIERMNAALAAMKKNP